MAGAPVALPRLGPGQPIAPYLDQLVTQTEIAIQQATAPGARPPVVSGSCGGNAALASLCAALATAGVITNKTTP